ALSLAIDRKALVEKITRGGETPAVHLVPPKTGTYQSPTGVVSGDFEKDLALAKKLLKEAGYENGKGIRPLTLQYDQREIHKRVAQAIQEMWKKNLGIEIILMNQEWKVYLQQQK